MLLLVGAVLAYAGLGLLLSLARDRIVFPIRGGPAGEPRRFGVPDGEAVAIATPDGDRLAGWFLPAAPAPGGPAPALIWFHGNGETVAGIAPVLRAFRPPGVAVLALDYRGYGASSGAVTVAGAEADALLAWDAVARRGDVDMARIVVYGRSVGSGPATFLAASRPAAGLILESPFTSLGGMVRAAVPLYPGFLAGRGFDNAARLDRVACPVLVIHGGADRTVPTRMGRELAARAGARGELWIIPGAGHNDTYDLGGEAYVRRVRSFVERVTR